MFSQNVTQMNTNFCLQEAPNQTYTSESPNKLHPGIPGIRHTMIRHIFSRIFFKENTPICRKDRKRPSLQRPPT